jgi:homoprotocatechuate degradation regulator HpaR
VAMGRAGDGGAEPRLRDFSKSLPMSLLRAREAVMRHFRASLRRHDLTEQQWRVLRALTDQEAIEAAALARATFLLPPSLSRILRDLEERGLVVRGNAREDLRRARVSISPRGLAVIEAVAPESERIYARIADAFGPEDLVRLQSLLHELERRATALAPAEGEADGEADGTG